MNWKENRTHNARIRRRLRLAIRAETANVPDIDDETLQRQLSWIMTPVPSAGRERVPAIGKRAWLKGMEFLARMATLALTLIVLVLEGVVLVIARSAGLLMRSVVQYRAQTVLRDLRIRVAEIRMDSHK